MTSPLGVPPDIDRGFVRILHHSDGKAVGCGFLISNQFVCTCAHVVAQALDKPNTLGERPTAAITLDFPRLSGSPTVTARVAEKGWLPLRSEDYRPEDGDQDIALLTIDGTLPAKARPLAVSTSAMLWRHPFGAFGYPEEAHETGVWATGQILGSDGSGLIQVEGTQTLGIFLKPGFSGTPVWSEIMGSVVGMVDLADAGERRIAFAIPIRTVERLRPGILTEGRTPIDRLSKVPFGAPPGFGSRVRDFLSFYIGSENEPKPFGGRAEDINALNTWALDPRAGGRLLLVAPAGRGKSALLVHWVAQLPADWRLVFVPVSLRFDTNRAEHVFQALAAHLSEIANPGTPLRKPLTDPFGYYHGKVHEYLAALEDGSQTPVVIVVDGLDEGAGFEGVGRLFPSRIPSGVKLVVSARRTALAPDAERWKERLNWDDRVATRELTCLTREGLEEVLNRMGFPLAELAKDTDIVGALLRLTEGDPLLVGLYVERLWQRGDEAARLKPDDLGALAPGYAGYFRKWFDDHERLWAGQHPPLASDDVRALLAVLAHAMGLLQAAAIQSLVARMTGCSTAPVEDTVRALHRFVMGRPDTSGYVLAHPKIADFLREPDNGVLPLRVSERAGEAFLEWGREVLRAWAVKEPSFDEARRHAYLLNYYGSHLLRARRPLEEFMALVENGWRRGWMAWEGSDRGFSRDVAIALDRVKQALDDARAGTIAPSEAPAAELIRCTLFLTSMRSQGTRVSNDLLCHAVKAGVLSPIQAIGLIDLGKDGENYVGAAVALAPLLRGELQHKVLGKALAAARAIKTEEYRSEALTALAPHLPADAQRGVLAEALAAARAIQDEEYRSPALVALAPHLPADAQRGVLAEALAAARAIQDEEYRSPALAGLAPHLPADQLAEALAAARAIKSEEYRSEALATLAPHLEADQLAEALAATRAIANEDSRSRALAALAPHLPADQLAEALAAARAIKNEGSRSRALAALAPHLPADAQRGVLAEALAAARAIEDEYLRSEALAGLAPYLPADAQRGVLAEALAAARAIKSDYSRSVALAGLAPHLPADQLAEALAAARAIKSDYSRSEALAALAPHLPADAQRGVLAEALAAARAIGDEDSRSRALAALAPHLPADAQCGVLAEALTAARVIKKEHSRSRALAALAPHLPADQLAEALAAARAIEDEYLRSRALAALTPHLPADAQRGVLAEALAAARAIKDEGSRSRALAALAPHLPADQLAEALAAAFHENEREALLRDLAAFGPRLCATLPADKRTLLTRSIIEAGRWWP